jgi:serine/threonine-protein kinase
MATVLPKANPGIEMQDTRISAEPPGELPAPPSRRPYGPGDLIDGKYELEALLGKGGMGEVWTARNETLGVRRAVKLIRADAGSADSTDRLLHEAQAAARLADPAIVRVFDFGKTRWGDPYIVMEMLEGEDLMSVINRRERLSPTKAVRVLLPVIRALGAAHAHGIVHRDLKPENIFLTDLPEGRVQPKLLDFGIAKLANARALRLTSAGAVMGSPLYMAPEQARGEDVDERADIWAVCVVLYEAITGSPPFSGDDRAQVIRAALEVTPARLSHYGVKDNSLWPIIMRGLEKRREDRWPSMTELGRALARWLLDAKVSDDITGASLEAGWFRSSRQSLFASSLPPDHRFGGARRLFAVARRRGRVALALVRVRGSEWLGAFERLDRPRRLGLALAVAASMAALIGFMGGDEPERQDAAAPDLTVEPQPAPSLPPAPEPAPPLSPSPALTTGPSASPASPPISAAPSRRPQSRAGRKVSRPSDNVPAAPSKEHRRSKLIDPYQ